MPPFIKATVYIHLSMKLKMLPLAPLSPPNWGGPDFKVPQFIPSVRFARRGFRGPSRVSHLSR